MNALIKNLCQQSVISLKNEIDILKGQVVSKTLAQNNALTLTLFAFDKDEEISTHKSHGDAMVNVLEGQCRVTIEDTSYIVNAGESIIMPAGKPHAVFASEQFKMLLLVIFPS